LRFSDRAGIGHAPGGGADGFDKDLGCDLAGGFAADTCESEAALGASEPGEVEALDVNQMQAPGVGFAVASRQEVEDAESDLAQSAIETGFDLAIFDGFDGRDFDMDIGVDVGGGDEGSLLSEELVQN